MILYLQSLFSNEHQKMFLFLLHVFDDELPRLPHQTSHASWNCCICLDWNCKAREDFEICIFMHFKVCDIYRSHSSGVRQSSHTDHWEAQQNAKERNDTVRTPLWCWRRLKMSCFWYLMLLWKREGWALSFMQVKLQTEWGTLTTGGVFREHHGSCAVLCSIRNGPQAAHLHCQRL